jgi:xanthine dehydrogenase molybdopterin-binding subunit B
MHIPKQASFSAGLEFSGDVSAVYLLVLFSLVCSFSTDFSCVPADTGLFHLRQTCFHPVQLELGF